MSKPAARLGDVHTCPVVAPGGVPHAGGPISSGCKTVWIEGRLAATVGSVCVCVGGLDEIKTGSTGVYIEGKKAARQGDQCAHGGMVVTGSITVLIGEKLGRMLASKPGKDEKREPNEGLVEPSQEEKNVILNQAIQECIVLLERKLKMLESQDSKTMGEFKKWFGRDDETAVKEILDVIRKALGVAKKLTLDNFDVIVDEFKRGRSFAIVYSDDVSRRIIYLGDLFWRKEKKDGRSKGSTLVHELSHFDDIGGTVDHDYGIEQCLYLVQHYPKQAFSNAENFEYFIVA